MDFSEQQQDQHQPLRLNSQENDTNHSVISCDLPQPPSQVPKKRKRSSQDHADSMFPNIAEADERKQSLRVIQRVYSARYLHREKMKEWSLKSCQVISSKGYRTVDTVYGYINPEKATIDIVLSRYLQSVLWKEKNERNINNRNVRVPRPPIDWPESELRAAFAKAQCKDLEANLAEVPGNELIEADTLNIDVIKSFLVNTCGMKLTAEIQQPKFEDFLRMKYACFMRLKKQHLAEHKQLRTFPTLVNEMEGSKIMAMLDQGCFIDKFEKRIIKHIKKNRFGTNVLVDLVHGQKGGSLNYSCLQELHDLNPDLMPAGNTVALYSRDLTNGFSDWFSYFPEMDYQRKHIHYNLINFLSTYIYCSPVLQSRGRTVEQIRNGDLPIPIIGDMVADGAKLDSKYGTAVWSYWRNTDQEMLAMRFMPQFIYGVTQLDPFNASHYPSCQSIDNCTLLGSCMAKDTNTTNKILLEEPLKEIQRLRKPGEYLKWYKQEESRTIQLLYKVNITFVADLVGIWKVMWGSAKKSDHFCINCITKPIEVGREAPFRCLDCRGKGPIPYWLPNEEVIPCKHTEFMDSNRIKNAQAETNMHKLKWMFHLKSLAEFNKMNKMEKLNYINEVVPISRRLLINANKTVPQLVVFYNAFSQVFHINTIDDCLVVPKNVIVQNLMWCGVDITDIVYMTWLREQIVNSMFDEKFAAATAANGDHDASKFSNEELRIALQFVIYEGRILRTFRNLPDTCLITMPEIVCCCLLHCEKRWRTRTLEITVAEAFKDRNTAEANAVIASVKVLLSQALAGDDPDDPDADAHVRPFNFEDDGKRVIIKTQNTTLRKFMTKNIYRDRLFYILFGDDSSRRDRKQLFSELWNLLEKMIELSLLKQKYTEYDLRDFQKACDRFGVKWHTVCSESCYIHMATSGELRDQIRRCNYSPLYLHAGHGMEKCNGVNAHIWCGKCQKGGHSGATPGRSSPIDAFKPIFLHDSLNLFCDCGRKLPQEFRSALADHGKAMRLEKKRDSYQGRSTTPVNPPRQTKKSRYMELASPEQLSKNWSQKKIGNYFNREHNNAIARQSSTLESTPDTTVAQRRFISPAPQRTTQVVTPATPPTTSYTVVWPCTDYPCDQRPRREMISSTDGSLLSPQQLEQENRLLNALQILGDTNSVSSAPVRPVTPATPVIPTVVVQPLPGIYTFSSTMSYVEMADAFSILPVPSLIDAMSTSTDFLIAIDHNVVPRRDLRLKQIDLGASYDRNQMHFHKDMEETNRCFYLHLALATQIHAARLCATVRGLAISKLEYYQSLNSQDEELRDIPWVFEVLRSAILKNEYVEYSVLKYAWPRTFLKCGVHFITEQEFRDHQNPIRTLRDLSSIYPPIDICPDITDKDLQHVFLRLYHGHYSLIQVYDNAGELLTGRAALQHLSLGVSPHYISSVHAE